VYLPEGAQIRAAAGETVKAPAAKNKQERIEAGKLVFATNCQACHQPTGLGIPNAFPPLASSDFFNADMKRVVQVVTGGLTGKVTVNGKEFNGVMPAWHLSDEDIASVLTFVSSSWGNKGDEFTPAFVAQNRVAATAPAPSGGQ
jgi:nitrite reductase (NO-forming)